MRSYKINRTCYYPVLFLLACFFRRWWLSILQSNQTFLECTCITRFLCFNVIQFSHFCWNDQIEIVVDKETLEVVSFMKWEQIFFVKEAVTFILREQHIFLKEILSFIMKKHDNFLKEVVSFLKKLLVLRKQITTQAGLKDSAFFVLHWAWVSKRNF